MLASRLAYSLGDISERRAEAARSMPTRPKQVLKKTLYKNAFRNLTFRHIVLTVDALSTSSDLMSSKTETSEVEVDLLVGEEVEEDEEEEEEEEEEEDDEGEEEEEEEVLVALSSEEGGVDMSRTFCMTKAVKMNAVPSGNKL